MSSVPNWTVKGHNAFTKVYTSCNSSVVVDESDGRLNLIAKVIVLEDGVRIKVGNLEINVKTEQKLVEIN